MAPPARTPGQRRDDTLRRFERDEDAWVATAGDGGPHLVPLSFLWDGVTFVLATPSSSPTGRNLRESGRARLGIGPTRDVVMVEGAAEVIAEVTGDLGDAFAARTGFEPRGLDGYAYYRVRPERIQAWREANEIAGRDLMRDGRWLV
ncbi:pyridoxamine 5'-phosphate oxidase family protein [Actinomadura sp. DC4]|uniref:pyridoxamine 5'-phosphate oxidase family protein n=1 Tax=Actinomadura sp. DC4 TaxID=3055069 RepID=UPI0025B11EF8|nr:pyridoxamine 5'-phosphate oxidase family protein [Actinomadura sp. DC4]MDN3351270.1 pyridoxamine 5'-phosphate oxidase family protein [Actinomadura sp. DC4]